MKSKKNLDQELMQKAVISANHITIFADPCLNVKIILKYREDQFDNGYSKKSSQLFSSVNECINELKKFDNHLHQFNHAVSYSMSKLSLDYKYIIEVHGVRGDWSKLESSFVFYSRDLEMLFCDDDFINSIIDNHRSIAESVFYLIWKEVAPKLKKRNIERKEANLKWLEEVRNKNNEIGVNKNGN